MSPRCALWARVSTGEQESANQLAGLRAWAGRRGLEVAAEYVLEGASAWTGAHRAQLRQALDDARAGRLGAQHGELIAGLLLVGADPRPQGAAGGHE